LRLTSACIVLICPDHYVVLAASPRGSVFGPFASEIRDVDIERMLD
jgi:hypothetical protein